jgi:GNAT superfamily N-acetyltransferase
VTRHRLADLLDEAARGRFPPADERVEVLPAPPGAAMAVVAFTGHHVVAADVAADWVRAQLPDGDLLAPMSPAFIGALGKRIGRRDDGVDVVLAATGLEGAAELAEVADCHHPRAVRAQGHRRDVPVFEAEAGAATVILGHGLALRAEVAVEVDEGARGRGIAARALQEARRLVGPGEVVFAQVSPGNAASLRAFLRAGFEPTGCEVLFF